MFHPDQRVKVDLSGMVVNVLPPTEASDGNER